MKKGTRGPMRQWERIQVQWNMGPAQTYEVSLNSDPQNAWSFDGRVLRLLLKVSLYTGDSAYGADPGSMLRLGLIMKPLAMGNSFSLMGSADVDAGWLYRATYRLSVGRSNETLDLNDNYDLDWPIHGGKGAHLCRDNHLVLCAEWAPPQGSSAAGTVLCTVDGMMLVVAD